MNIVNGGSHRGILKFLQRNIAPHEKTVVGFSGALVQAQNSVRRYQIRSVCPFVLSLRSVMHDLPVLVHHTVQLLAHLAAISVGTPF